VCVCVCVLLPENVTVGEVKIQAVT
jgi:hypothetical protein